MQVSNPLKGFIVTEQFDEGASKEYGVSSVGNVTIRPGTSPALQLEKVNKGTATEKAME